MNKRHWLRNLFLLAILAVCSSAPAAASQLILTLAAGADINQITTEYGLVLNRAVDDGGACVYLVSAPDPPDAVLLQLFADPSVLGVEPDMAVDNQDTPTINGQLVDFNALAAAIQNSKTVTYFGSGVRSGFVQQGAADVIRLTDALKRFGTGRGTVAIIDTGVDPNHPALRRVLVPGFDFTRNQAGYGDETADLTQSTVAILDQSTVAILDSKNSPFLLNQSTVAILDQSTVAILDGSQIPSDFGHGTMVAGLIHLVAPTARIMPLKAFNSDGTANLSDIVNAIYYAVNNGANVINMSFSSVNASPTITAALNYAWSNNVICVASAGNDGGQVMVYPAGTPGVLGVASTSMSDQISLFSNYGVQSAQLGAPGEGLVTTYPGNNYAVVWGTSFSTALTSGAAALLLQVAPGITANQGIQVLQSGQPLQTTGLAERLDIYASLLGYLNPQPDPQPPAGGDPTATGQGQN